VVRLETVVVQGEGKYGKYCQRLHFAPRTREQPVNDVSRATTKFRGVDFETTDLDRRGCMQ
jgi:hypothetical protein